MTQIGACVGTKELVAGLPHLLRLRDPQRDTVLYPAVAYPSYEMGSTLAGKRAVPVPLDRNRHVDLRVMLLARRGQVVFGDPAPVKTCPACLSTDLPAAASKCKYCGTDQPVTA